MPEKYNLRRLLQEIADDDSLVEHKSAKLSQADINRLVSEKRRQRPSPSPPHERRA